MSWSYHPHHVSLSYSNPSSMFATKASAWHCHSAVVTSRLSPDRGHSPWHRPMVRDTRWAEHTSDMRDSSEYTGASGGELIFTRQKNWIFRCRITKYPVFLPFKMPSIVYHNIIPIFTLRCRLNLSCGSPELSDQRSTRGYNPHTGVMESWEIKCF